MCLSNNRAFTHSTSNIPCFDTHAPTHKGASTPRQQHIHCITPCTSLHVANQSSSLQRQQSIISTQTSFVSNSAISSPFNHISKVLFMCPSWYLFAIGFANIISLGWTITTNFALHFQGTWLVKHIPYTKGHTTQTGMSPSSKSSPQPLHVHLCWKSVWRKQFKVINLNVHTRHIPVRSPLLKDPHLVSNPPLTCMLKFSGSLCLMSCSCTSQSDKLLFTMQVWTSNHCNYNNWCSNHMACCTIININESVAQSVQTLTQSCPQECPKGASAFNGQLIHGILQFTMIIVLCCTLHQHVNQDMLLNMCCPLNNIESTTTRTALLSTQWLLYQIGHSGHLSTGMTPAPQPTITIGACC